MEKISAGGRNEEDKGRNIGRAVVNQEVINVAEIATRISIEEILKRNPQLADRLEDLNHPYHNKQHTIEVATRLLEFLKNLSQNGVVEITNLANSNNVALSELLEWLVEATLRHDDSHSGNIGNKRSEKTDERLAVKLLYQDNSGYDRKEAKMWLIQRMIQCTTFTLENSRFRPRTALEKIFKLADFGGLLFKSWDDWILEYKNLCLESPSIKPSNYKDLLKNRRDFLINHIQPLLIELEKFLSLDFYGQIYNQFRQKLEMIELLELLESDSFSLSFEQSQLAISCKTKIQEGFGYHS